MFLLLLYPSLLQPTNKGYLTFLSFPPVVAGANDFLHLNVGGNSTAGKESAFFLGGGGYACMLRHTEI